MSFVGLPKPKLSDNLAKGLPSQKLLFFFSFFFLLAVRSFRTHAKGVVNLNLGDARD